MQREWSENNQQKKTINMINSEPLFVKHTPLSPNDESVDNTFKYI